ncbi:MULTISPECIES: hypothetical protein [unclassified Cellulophaga]|uniref:hypothetical protein n=1 Tax=unclassified Cellulophaga TaxID=2634405 RepID=UPI0026E4866C|nr:MULTISPECIES: hypothetical protein [unclassified Cellulophaga]MDO6489869.1 hypothetical protein [Cellulophaga sp. 2_MG-2023]MDO6494937.1 hypothetical protein [Cellulophaga sp. 3_MG-2023]
MRKKKAIRILEEQKQKVLSPDHPNNQEWIFETASYIKDFFGFESTEYAWIAQFKWHVKTLNTDFASNEEIREMLAEKPKKVVSFLDNCKRILENKGLFKELKNNLLSDKSNAALIGTIFTISSIVFGIGFYFGTEKTNNELIRTENKLVKLKDSLSLIKTFDSTNGMTNDKEKITKPENNDN